MSRSVINTQSSSAPRIKTATVGEDQLKQLYSMYKDGSDSDFENLCIDIIERGQSNSMKKRAFVRQVQQATDRNAKLKKTQDYILAGMGLGV